MSHFIVPRFNMNMFPAVVPSSRSRSVFDDTDMALFDLAPSRRMLHDPFADLMSSMDRSIVTSPSCNISQDDTKYEVALDVPGIRSSDIKVQLEHGGKVLHVSGERKSRDAHQTTEYKFDRRWALSDDIDISKVKANAVDGVLVVTVPKKPKEEKKADEVMEIEVASVPVANDGA